jgi:hypothetical protein
MLTHILLLCVFFVSPLAYAQPASSTKRKVAPSYILQKQKKETAKQLQKQQVPLKSTTPETAPTTPTIDPKCIINKAGGEYDNPWVTNVPEKFERISTTGMLSHAYKYSGNTPAFRNEGCRYTQCFTHNGKKVGGGFINFLGYGLIGGMGNHFQGIARLPEYLGLGQYLLVTGNNPHNDPYFGPQAHLFVIKMGAQPATGLFTSEQAKSRDNVIQQVINLTEDFPGYIHPGGIQTCGKYLTIPLEGRMPAKIAFYELAKKPDNTPSITKLKVEVSCPTGQDGATALARLNDGHYIIGCWGDTRGLDFYYSKACNVDDGFTHVADLHPTFGATNPQNINLINDIDGSLYLVATYNDNLKTPYKKWPVNYRGNDIAVLFKVVIPQKISEAPDGSSGGFKLIQIGSKTFKQNDGYNFAAAAGIYIPNTDAIYLYSSSHWLVYNTSACQPVLPLPKNIAEKTKENALKNIYMNIMQFAQPV